jgi:hypothetical protein
MRLAIQQIARSPEQFQRLAPLAEQIAALASAPEDSPEIERLAELVVQSGLAELVQSMLPKSSPALEGPFGDMMGAVLLSAYSPAQRRFLQRIQERLTPPTTERTHEKER